MNPLQQHELEEEKQVLSEQDLEIRNENSVFKTFNKSSTSILDEQLLESSFNISDESESVNFVKEQEAPNQPEQSNNIASTLNIQRRKTREQEDFQTFKIKIEKKIKEISGIVQRSKSKAQILKNKKLISGYECRLMSRAKEEDMKENLKLRELQVNTMI